MLSCNGRGGGGGGSLLMILDLDKLELLYLKRTTEKGRFGSDLVVHDMKVSCCNQFKCSLPEINLQSLLSNFQPQHDIKGSS